MSTASVTTLSRHFPCPGASTSGNTDNQPTCSRDADVGAGSARHLHGHGHLDWPCVVEPVPQLVLRRNDVGIRVGRRGQAPLWHSGHRCQSSRSAVSRCGGDLERLERKLSRLIFAKLLSPLISKYMGHATLFLPKAAPKTLSISSLSTALGNQQFLKG